MTTTFSSRAAAVPGPPADLVAQRFGGPDLTGVPDFLCEVAERYGPIASLEVPHKRYYLVSGPGAIREVLVTKAGSFRKGRGTDALHQVIGNGLFTSEPPEHTAQRRLVQPAFHHRQIAGMARVMVEQTEALCAEWRQDNVVDAGRAMRRLALRIGGISLFSHAFDDYEDRVGAALTDVMSHATSGIFGRLSEQFTSERMRRFQAARATLHAVADELIAQRSRETSDEAHDLFDMLAGSDECEALGARAELRDRVLTLLLAAQESTAIALTWALYLLASHPAVQSRLHDELDTVLGGRSCTVEDVRELPYTVAIFKEALRLFPPAWILGRRAREPVHVGGVSLPRGSAVYISPYVVHRDAHRYADALYFRPERWLQTPEPTAFSYLPFGRGARGCVGEPFAWMEGTIVLAVIASRFALSVVDDRPVPTSPLLTLRPARPIQLRVHALPTP